MNALRPSIQRATLAAMRRVGRVRAKQMRREHMGRIWLAGTLMAMPLTIPLINLIIPILGGYVYQPVSRFEWNTPVLTQFPLAICKVSRHTRLKQANDAKDVQEWIWMTPIDGS